MDKELQLRIEKRIKEMDKPMLHCIMKSRIFDAIIKLYDTQADTREEKEMLTHIGNQIHNLKY